MHYLLSHSHSPVAIFDASAQVYEIFSFSFGAPPDCIGCADTLEEAQAIAQAWWDEE
jgi:hypothetical protein